MATESKNTPGNSNRLPFKCTKKHILPTHNKNDFPMIDVIGLKFLSV